MTDRQKWSFDGTYFMPARSVSNSLPPGLYDTAVVLGTPLFRPVDLKTDDLCLLPRTATEGIIREIRKFWGAGDVFRKYGFVHKRGVLLHGPPGTGKTSLINLVSAEAKELGAVCLRMSNPSALKVCVHAFRKAQVETPLVVFIEDLDYWDDEEELLNLLDGSDSVENVVFVATTNYISNIAARVRNRPSRFDHVVEIGQPGMAARTMFFEHISKGDKDNYVEWAEKTEGLSFAHLKELFIAVKILGHDFTEAVTKLRAMETLGEDPPKDEDEDC